MIFFIISIFIINSKSKKINLKIKIARFNLKKLGVKKIIRGICRLIRQNARTLPWLV